MEQINQLHGYSASKHNNEVGCRPTQGGLVEHLEFRAPVPNPKLGWPQECVLENQSPGRLGPRLEPPQPLHQLGPLSHKRQNPSSNRLKQEECVGSCD